MSKITRLRLSRENQRILEDYIKEHKEDIEAGRLSKTKLAKDFRIAHKFAVTEGNIEGAAKIVKVSFSQGASSAAPILSNRQVNLALRVVFDQLGYVLEALEITPSEEFDLERIKANDLAREILSENSIQESLDHA